MYQGMTNPFLPSFQIDGARQQILGAIYARGKTDRIVSPLWLTTLIILIVVGAIVGPASILAMVGDFISNPTGVPLSLWTGMIAFMVIGIVSFAILGALAYVLISRQNEHFRREAQLRMGLISLIRASALTPEKDSQLAVEIATMTLMQNDANYREREHWELGWAIVIGFSWALMVLAPFIVLYFLHFMSKEIAEHDARWAAFVPQAQSALWKLGYSPPQQYWISPLPRRSSGLYIVLTVITLGLFGIYWLYVLTEDPTRHYRAQAMVEDMIADVITKK